MKKAILISSIIAANISLGMAQDTYQALTLSSDEPVLGTARYSGMAGAMSSFGGNASTLKDNPAGLGVYRKSDISLTPNLHIDNDGQVGMNINNFGIIINFGSSHNKSGYVTSSFGISYNRLRNFSSSTYTEGTHSVAVDSVTTKQKGYGNEFSTDHGSGEWDFSYGLNISNMVFLGVGVNAVSLHYTESTLFNDGQYGDEETSYDIDGNGWNVKAGVIVKPADFMRLNLAFQSPTWYSLNEDNIYPEYGSDAIKGSYMQQKEIDDIEYDLQTPLKFNGGVGFVIDKMAIIGIDYIYQDYTAMREKDDKGQFRNIKNDINKVMKATNTIKVGAEFQLGNGFALRGGLAYVTSPTKDLSRSYLLTKDEDHSVVLPKEATYYTLGFGYAGKSFYTDLAYIHKSQKEDFYEWMNHSDIKDPISQTEDTNDIMLTLGLRF